MKIDNPLLSQTSANALQQSGGVSETRGGSGNRARLDGTSDRVQLSNLSAALLDQPAEDPARAQSVQAIGSAVQSGSYRIDAAALGRKIIQEFTSA
jgi:anti-sigma28 factor (negative regulator of flagellin synthesis)